LRDRLRRGFDRPFQGVGPLCYLLRQLLDSPAFLEFCFRGRLHPVTGEGHHGPNRFFQRIPVRRAQINEIREVVGRRIHAEGQAAQLPDNFQGSGAVQCYIPSRPHGKRLNGRFGRADTAGDRQYRSREPKAFAPLFCFLSVEPRHFPDEFHVLLNGVRYHSGHLEVRDHVDRFPGRLAHEAAEHGRVSSDWAVVQLFRASVGVLQRTEYIEISRELIIDVPNRRLALYTFR
jgi:hypothetical protein